MARRDEITVVLPVYNGEATIGSAVGSTLRALPADGRLLVHDDASTDRTPEILAGITDRRLSVVRSETGRGASEGVNLLLKQVETPLVARIDGDDVSLPWRFRAMAEAIRSADVVFSTVAGIGDVGFGRLRPGPPLPITADAMRLHLLVANPVAASTMLARTEVIRAYGYRQTTAEDYDLWLRICAAGHPIRRIGLPTVLYRFHPQQATAQHGYRAAAFTDPLLRDSYAAVSRTVLGREPDWFGDLHPYGEPVPGADERLRGFAEAMRAAAAPLRADQRVLLLRKLDNAIAAAAAAR